MNRQLSLAELREDVRDFYYEHYYDPASPFLLPSRTGLDKEFWTAFSIYYGYEEQEVEYRLKTYVFLVLAMKELAQ